ncbi:MAG: zinc-binding dehydrogenase [Tumebacillaceae bacterium]
MQAAVEFFNEHQLRPTISDTFSLDEVLHAFEQLEHAAQFGKIVLTIE